MAACCSVGAHSSRDFSGASPSFPTEETTAVSDEGPRDVGKEHRRALLKQQLAVFKRKLEEEGETVEEVTRQGSPVATGPPQRTLVRFPDGRGDIVVVIGTSSHAQEPGLVERICDIVYAAYTNAGKRKRMDEEDVLDRLEMGDDGPRANRVLHLAFQSEALVGCASSTFSPGWTPDGCGHWGLLAVDPRNQGRGVATALVLAAERRLSMQSSLIQIEYQYTVGDDFSQRLMAWYEDKLGFNGGPCPQRPGQSCFRRALKQIPEKEQQRGQRRRLEEIYSWLSEQLAEEERAYTTPNAS